MLPILICALLSAAPVGQIAFVAGGAPADQAVSVIDIESGSITRLGPGTADGAPRWSPDGRRIAFDTRSEVGRSIYVVNADGTAPRYLPHAARMNCDPAWSPDGERLAYAVGRGLGRRIAVFDFATDRETVWGGEHTGLMRPRWVGHSLVQALLSPEDRDAAGIVRLFGSTDTELVGLVAAGLVTEPGGTSTDLFLATPDMTIPFPEDVLPSKGSYAEWNPAPAHAQHALAFESDDGGDRELFVYSRRGVIDLTNHRAADWNPVWSPDDKWLAFESFRGGSPGIYRVHRDTARVYPVSVTPNAANWSPSWSPDGEWIVFVTDRTGVPRLFIANTNSEEVVPLTHGDDSARAPAWRPRR